MKHSTVRLVGALALTCLCTAPLSAQAWSSARPDGHAPIGVMGDHTHSKGEMMLSYRFMRMSMDGNRDGTGSSSPAEVLEDFMVTPLTMPMTMHMVGVMLAPSDRVTLMGMLPLVSSDMDHRTRMGGEFTTSSSGMGDLGLSALVRLFNRDRTAAHLNVGVRIPTGAIDAMDVTPASAPNEVVLPYPMQLGSGTFDLQPGITLLGQGDLGSWGAQLRGTYRLGENDRGYRLGHEGAGTAWLALKGNDWISLSFRAEGRIWGNVSGADDALNPMMVPTADPDRRAGKRVDLGAGFNFEVAEGALHGQRLAVEMLWPVWQDLDGPQLETDWVLTAGWQYAFQLWGKHH